MNGLRVLKPRPEVAKLRDKAITWLPILISSFALAVSASTAYFASEGLKNFARQNLHAKQISACSRFITAARAFRWSLHEKCFQSDGPLGFTCDFSSSNPSLTFSNKGLTQLTELDSAGYELELVLPPSEISSINRVMRTAEHLFASKLDPMGALAMVAQFDYFDAALANLRSQCKSRVQSRL